MMGRDDGDKHDSGARLREETGGRLVHTRETQSQGPHLRPMANESLGQLLLDGRVWCEGGELESHHIRCVAKLLRLLLVRTRPVPVALHRIALKRRALGMVLCDGTSPDKAELLVKGDRRHRRLNETSA